jgi:hypothetical protein
MKNEIVRNAFQLDDDTEKKYDFEVEDGDGIGEATKHSLSDAGAFKQYKALEDIAVEIAKEILLTGKEALIYKKPKVSEMSVDDIVDFGYTFFMSSEGRQRNAGLLSICPAVLTAMKIWRKIVEAEAETEYKIKEAEVKGNNEIKDENKSKVAELHEFSKNLFEHIKAGIEAIFNIIYRYRSVEQKIDDNEVPVFDASPYELDGFSRGLEKGKSYIDSISWAIPVFLRILNLTQKEVIKKEKIIKEGKKEVKKEKLEFNEKLVFDEKNYKDLRDKAKFLAKWCLEYVNESLLYTDTDRTTPIGWSFTRLSGEGNERSLYFTYAASTIYLSFYDEYREIIQSLRTLEAIKRRISEGDSTKHTVENYKDVSSNKEVTMEDPSNIHFDFSEVYWKKKELDTARKFYKGKLDTINKTMGSQSKNEKLIEIKQSIQKNLQALNILLKPENINGIDGYENKIEMFLTEFNNGKRITNEVEKGDKIGVTDKIGQIGRLKWNLEQISKQIWESVAGENGEPGEKLEKYFLYDDVNAAIAQDEAIKNVGQTNALFTGLLQIGIIINCAYDDKIKNEGRNEEKNGGRNEVRNEEYKIMQNTMYLHIQRTQRFFDKLKDANKAFGVEFLVLRFMENVTDSNDRTLAEKLRKQNIRVCSLTPMLLKTNNLLSEYVIRYPQKQMGESLLSISQKRYMNESTGNGEPRWLWESDSYHAISNYYYVGAIFDFYDYYEKYEKAYVTTYDNMRDKLLRDIEFTSQIREYYQAKGYEVDRLAQELSDARITIERKNEEIQKFKSEDILSGAINTLLKKATYFEEREFYKKIINGIRRYLAEELAERYPNASKETKEMLKIPSAPEDENKIFLLLQALAGDMILSSALESKRGKAYINGLGLGLEDTEPAVFALKGSKRLNEGGLNEIFAGIIPDSFKWIK